MRASEPDSPALSTSVKGRQFTDTTIAAFIETVGKEYGVRFAVQDRLVSDNGTVVGELLSTRVSVTLEDGTLESELRKLSSVAKSFRWTESEGVVWLINPKAGAPSPLETHIQEMKFEGMAMDLAISLNKFDQRIPDSYIWTSNPELAASQYRVGVHLQNTILRTVLSACVTNSPNRGLLLGFYEYAPGEIRADLYGDKTPHFSVKFYSGVKSDTQGDPRPH